LQPFAASYKTVPVFRVVPSAECDPLVLFRALKNISRHCFILESLEDSKETGRWTFLGYDPRLEISCKDGMLLIKNGFELNVKTDDPATYIRKILDDNRAPRFAELPPFTGGLVGYFAYDYIKYAEPTLTLSSQDAEQFRDLDLMLFDKVIAFDNFKRQIHLIINIKTDALQENYNRAQQELASMERLLSSTQHAPLPPLALSSPFIPEQTKERYCAMVERAKRYIREGDIFQVVLSNRFTAKAEGSLFETYRTLRRSNPSPYMFYFSSDALEIAGCSPETLVRLQEGSLFTYPLAGTRPRGADKAQDRMLEEELLRDPKECAEHNMLVDLGRNDLGKISKFGTVEVKKYMSILRFSHVMHIGSTVSGEIRDDKGALDAIAAVLPAGTLSGAPKIRACEIINELEGSKRGIYGGAIGYLSLSGDMDTCIAIRIAYKKDGIVYVRSGAGIVADSVPESEYNECVNKAKAVLSALGGEL
jgi:anthranilate synthase component 1